METKQTEQKPFGFFRGFGYANMEEYPAWRHHKYLDPVIVTNTEQDEKVLAQGYEKLASVFSGYKGFINWFWDIEDMSPKQLVTYAKDEWDIDLPVDASQEELQKAIFKLVRLCPKNRDRIIFMAHEIKMNYDEVQQEIRDLSQNGMGEIERQVIEI